MNRKKLLFTSGATLVAITLLACGAGSDGDDTDDDFAPAVAPQFADPSTGTSGATSVAPQSVKVELIATGEKGAKKAMVSWVQLDSSNNKNDVTLPFKTETQTNPAELVSYYSISVMNNNATGTVKCEIKLAGKSVKKSQASGQYATASCDYTIDRITNP